MPEGQVKRYAGGTLGREDLVQLTGDRTNHALDRYVAMAYAECGSDMRSDAEHFSAVGDDLYSVDGATLYIGKISQDEDVFTDQALYNFVVTDGFYRFLAGLDSWSFAGGKFDAVMARFLRDE